MNAHCLPCSMRVQLFQTFIKSFLVIFCDPPIWGLQPIRALQKLLPLKEEHTITLLLLFLRF